VTSVIENHLIVSPHPTPADGIGRSPAADRGHEAEWYRAPLERIVSQRTATEIKMTPMKRNDTDYRLQRITKPLHYHCANPAKSMA
jgi:hypothetical protein